MLKSLVFAACCVCAAFGAAAAQSGAPLPAPAAVVASGDPTDPRIAIMKLLPAGTKLDDLRPSPIPGIYEYAENADISYITADGKFFIDGNVYDMHSHENLTEGERTR